MDIKKTLDAENNRHEETLRIIKLIEEKGIESTVQFYTYPTIFL